MNLKNNFLILIVIPFFTLLSGTILAFPFRKFPSQTLTFSYQLPYYITLIFNLILIFLLQKQKKIMVNKPLLYLILVLIISRVMFLTSRLIFGPLQIDGDITNFFNQGAAFSQNIIPLFEYPPLTLYFFSLIYKICQGNFNNFVFTFALTNLVFEVGLVTVIYKLTLLLKNKTLGFYSLLFYLISGYFTHFFYAKFDLLVMFLISFSFYKFLKKNYFAAALLATIGFSFKWFPVFLLAYLGVYLIKHKLYKKLLLIIFFFLFFQTLISYPIASREPDKLIYAYTFQGQREALAESIYLLPELILKTSPKINNLAAPWDALEKSFFGAKKTTLIQLLCLGTMILSFIFKKRSIKAAITFSSLSLIVFILLNRIFSAQFYIYLFFSYLIIFILLKKDKNLFLVSQLFLAALNFLIWPAFMPIWKLLVVMFFTINVLLLIFLTKPIIANGNNKG